MKNIIIKIGTSTLLRGSHKLSRQFMLSLVQQIAYLCTLGVRVTLVSSGAVAAGKEALSLRPQQCHQEKLLQRSAYASIGQIQLMRYWSDIFDLFDLQVAQVLLTKDNFSGAAKGSTRATIDMLLQNGIIPILNENDAATTTQSRIGDNDNLAALAAELLIADTIILLTDQEGLYTADPRFCSDAKLISTVTAIDQKLISLATGTATSCGTGGMITKVQAAKIAAKAGARTIIASAERPNVLIDLHAGKHIGTWFQMVKHS
jgi:glutamate 5-kinase